MPERNGVGTGPKRPPALRLFFALWPSEAQQQALEQAMRARVEATRGRAIPARNLHVTLAFLGSVPNSRIESVTACAGKLRGRAFELRWDQLEIWARSHVLCLTTSRMPSQLAHLEEQLRFNLLNAQFEIRQEEYRPHVTLARDVQRRNKLEAIVPISWPFAEFVLVQSRPGPSGSGYTVLDRWALASE
jgi:2'-5' RNA ligase